jgi:hypothetical protein
MLTLTYFNEEIMDIDFIDVSDPDDQSWQAEAFYFDTIDRMSDLIVAYGRNKVMTDVTEAVVNKLSELSKFGES